jgi:hypothetical protein
MPEVRVAEKGLDYPPEISPFVKADLRTVKISCAELIRGAGFWKRSEARHPAISQTSDAARE